MKPFTSKAAQPRGFALVATLSLMILLTILAVGLLSLSAVSLRSSTQGNAQAEARANARLALMLAIGELQKQLGPDQRISITADQRTEPGGDGSTTSSAPGKRHWTGVFDSWPATQDSRPDPVFRSWLVSGENQSPSDAETPAGGPDSVELVGAGTLGTGEGKVSVPATKFGTGDKAVRLAWWVGDQGVKAAIATQPATKDSSLGALRSSTQGAPRNAVEIASTGSGKPFSQLAPEDPRIPSLTGWRQAEFLASSPEAPRPLFHDLTDSSSGLLTNVRDGGFRKDLSMKFETFTAPPDLSDPANVLYTARSQMTGFNEVGINLMELWGYYHSYKDLKYGGGLSYTSGGSIPSSAPYLQTKRTQPELNTDPWDRFKHPVTINYQTIYSFEADPHPDEPGKQILWLNFDPVVTLWNPLDVPVDIPRHTVERQPEMELPV